MIVSDIPHAVLSEHFQERMKGMRLKTAVFLTFRFDSGFFEQEVLPVFLDVSLSHATQLRLVQLEDALRQTGARIAVYYDSNGLALGDAGSAKLDIRRIPVRHRTGIFHAKNAFLLIEAEEPDADGHHVRSLLVASMSANLTRAGWWENVEVCHVEEIAERDRTRMQDEIVAFLDWLRQQVPSEREHAEVKDIRDFLKRSIEQRAQRTTEGALHTHFYRGNTPVVDFLSETAGRALDGMYLEIISPYFDDASTSTPLHQLRERFQPKEVRVFLPRGPDDQALCGEALYASIRALPDVRWGRLPRELLRAGTTEEAGDRRVHAKVYRFFSPHPKREILFVGSANLTNAAHSRGGNLETGFLVEVEPKRRPDFWLTTDDRRPGTFEETSEDDGTAASGGTRLSLRYRWNDAAADAFWNDPKPGPRLRVEAQGVELFTLDGLPPRAWVPLDLQQAARLADVLPSTSLLTIHGEAANPGMLLVQEEGMWQKPSLLLRLSAADILRYWSLLTTEQRAAFLEVRAADLAATGQGADLVTRARLVAEEQSMFDRFAGVFHAFGCLERAVLKSIADKNERQAIYRLFGRKYDSLGNLLERVSGPQEGGDTVNRYVIYLCARQLCDQVRAEASDFWKEHADDAESLGQQLAMVRGIREEVIAGSPDTMPAFLAWFDPWFLRRAQPMESTS
jgi:hypothetical protein